VLESAKGLRDRGTTIGRRNQIFWVEEKGVKEREE